MLVRIARMLNERGLEAVLIGNAAAALHGAPVTTVDFDFMFRKTPAHLRRLKELAQALDAVVMRPYYPASDLFRVVRDEDGLQVDFMAAIHGVRSLATLQRSAKAVVFGDARLLVAKPSRRKVSWRCATRSGVCRRCRRTAGRTFYASGWLIACPVCRAGIWRRPATGRSNALRLGMDPGPAIRPAQHPVRFLIPDHALLLRVPLQRPTQLQGVVRENTACR